MALRLASTTATSTSPFKPFFDRLVEDGRISLGQKTDAVKTLQVVLKNAVTDPVKSQDPKYRQLKLGNAKLQQRLFSIPVVMEVLELVGFQTQSVDGEECLVLPAQDTISSTPTMGQECVAELQVTQQRLATIAGTGGCTNVKPAVPEKLSEKQKARRLMEERKSKTSSRPRKIASAIWCCWRRTNTLAKTIPTGSQRSVLLVPKRGLAFPPFGTNTGNRIRTCVFWLGM